MGLGSTAKKIQTVADRAEQLYKQLVDVRERVMALEETTTETADRVETIETELEKQRAVVDALAEERGIDVDQVLADAAIEDVDADDETDDDGDGDAENADSSAGGEGADAADGADGSDAEATATDDGASTDG